MVLTPSQTASASVAAVGPSITNAAITYGKLNGAVAIRGMAPAGALVALHYHRSGTASTDYSIVRNVRADSIGRWSRAFTLDTDYRVFATVGVGNPHSKTVLFTSAAPPPPAPKPTELGGIQNVRSDYANTTIGMQFAKINGYAKQMQFYPAPATGNRYVAVNVCARNRGPSEFNGSEFDFLLLTSAPASYDPSFVAVTDGPDVDFSHMLVGELRCGEVNFEVPIKSNVTALRYSPDSTHIIRWSTP